MRNFEINHDNLVNIISGAFTGSPWFEIDWDEEVYKSHKKEGDCIEDVLARILLDGGSFVVNDIEEEESYDLTKEKIWDGMVKLRDEMPRMYADFMEENDDMWTNDSIIQFAIFGELIYG